MALSGRSSRSEPDADPPAQRSTPGPSPRWLAPAMTAFFVVGVLWIAASYILSPSVGFLAALGNWNLLIGFVLIGVGFALSTRWR